MRFVAPLLAFAAAAYVYSKNQGAETEFIFLFPLNNIFEDPKVAAERSWQLLVFVGLLWMAGDVRSWVAQRKAADEAEAE